MNTNKKRMPGIEDTQHFLGVVVDINDPLKKGRCKINVFGLFDDLAVDDIPWAFQTLDISFGDQGGSGRFSTPQVGAIVHVIFNNGDYYSPEYKGLQEIGKGLQDELNDSYEGSHSIIYDGIEIVKIFYTKKKGLMLETKGSTINITNDDKITVNSKGEINLISPGAHINIQKNGEIDLVNPIASIKISEAGLITATGSTVTPNSQGGWCALPTDPYTGMIHIGDTLNP